MFAACFANAQMRTANQKTGANCCAASPVHRCANGLRNAEFDENSFCAVAGLSLRPQRAASRAEISVGDAITMIPPVTGNGMSMAFESAELAIAPLAAWSRGESRGTKPAKKSRAIVTPLLRAVLHGQMAATIILTPALQNLLVTLAARSNWFWRLAFERTR